MTSDNRDQLLAQARSFLDASPGLKFVDAFVADLNGMLRGKRLRSKSALKLFEAGLRLPRSAIWNDIWGADILEDSLVLDTGDRDGLCVPVETGFQPVPWAREPSAQLLMMMQEPDGTPFSGDPRQLLVQIAGRCAARGLFPVAAIELEFVLLADKLDDMGRPALPPSTGRARRLHDGQTYAVGELDAYGAFFGDLYDACDQQGLPLDSALAETGPAQFEVNLSHQGDVVRAADHAILLRRAIKGVAAKHGLLASFMAKPFTELPGNGLHVHMSMLDEQAQNIFDDGSPTGSEALRSAVAGLIATVPEAMIFFAPHLNSLRRYQASSHAPTRVSWGYDNRTAAIRIPSARGRNRRFENRIPGADANPYLVLAAILGGVLHGIDQRLVPPAPVQGNAYAEAGPDLPTDWGEALDGFTSGDVLASMFGPLLTRIFAACKRQEMRVAAARITDFEYDSYLRAF